LAGNLVEIRHFPLQFTAFRHRADFADFGGGTDLVQGDGRLAVVDGEIAGLVADFEAEIDERGHAAVDDPDVTAAVAPNACRDAGDLHVLRLAKTGRTAYIVAGDDVLLILKRFVRCRIITPRQFWSRMQRNK